MKTALRALALIGAACVAALAHGAESAPVITTRAQLDAHLSEHAGGNPLDALSPGARERFLYSLEFNEVGLVTMDPGDLADELTDEQIHAVFALFGPRVIPYAPKSRQAETKSLERRAESTRAIGAIERQYNDFYRALRDIDEPVSERKAQKLGELFDARLAALYTPRALRGADDHELRLLRTAAHWTADGTRLPRHVDAFSAVFAERGRRQIVSTGDVESLQRFYLTMRRFGDARRLASEYREARLAPLPQFSDSLGAAAGHPTVWRIEDSGKRLERTIVDLAPLQLLVTVACHVSKDAAADISADPMLGPVFEKHARWLVLAPGSESIDAALDWNHALPRAPVSMIYDRAEWSVLPAWSMPEFYVVRDGKVLESIKGWDGSSSTRTDLIAVLRRHGLLPTE